MLILRESVLLPTDFFEEAFFFSAVVMHKVLEVDNSALLVFTLTLLIVGIWFVINTFRHARMLLSSLYMGMCILGGFVTASVILAIDYIIQAGYRI